MTLDSWMEQYLAENKPRFNLQKALAVPAMAATIAAGMALSKPSYADVLVVPGTGVVYVQGQDATAQQLTVAGDAKSRLMPIAPSRNLPVDLDKYVGTSNAARFSVENGKDPSVSATNAAIFYTDKVAGFNGQALTTGSNGETTTLYVVGDAGKTVSLDCYNPAGDKVGTQTVTIPGNGVYTNDISSLFTALPDATVKTATAGVGLAARIAGATSRTEMGRPYSAATTTLKIVGIDLNGDGTADDVDANGDGGLDNTILTSCNFPIPYEWNVIVSPPGQYSFDATDLPQGMDFSQGNGHITFDPACNQAGLDYTVGLTVTDGITTSPRVYVPIRVTQ